ncbi:MAG: excinuclease ABC subunit UvrA [Ferrimicrobium sp.]|uniref:excinuclease ABC subunit UvrA n=1 Tax=Ferrimicrobium sp. TaxID=2926050 RepID=UPI00260C0F5B|nr:excinuclease ABC subunit UvrA [Ferrimicrobium sp.]
MPEVLRIQGAREHNLKNISLDIPRDRLVVFTGLSGSGKSSLAFDTIFAEGQRRYVESLSSYARQFLGLMEKPDLDFIEGLSPAISIDQKTASHNPRSTVATVTEIYDYLRLLFARIGRPHCPQCGREVAQQTPQEIVDLILAHFADRRVMIAAPIVQERKGEYQALLEDLTRQGFARVMIDDELIELSARKEVMLERYEAHSISVIVDRLRIDANDLRRLVESTETALGVANGRVDVLEVDADRNVVRIERYSEELACVVCGISLGRLEPRNFSFNSPFGACPVCSGLGVRFEVDEELVLPDPSRSLLQGAVAPFVTLRADYLEHMLERVAKEYKIPLTKPVGSLGDEARKIILYGVDEKVSHEYVDRRGRERSYSFTYEGVVNFLKRRHAEVESETARAIIESYMRQVPCEGCDGTRLKAEARAVTVDGISIDRFVTLPIGDALAHIGKLDLDPRDRQIAAQIVKEIAARLRFLVDVGLDYLTLSRSAATLSGGEAQRIRLASQIGSGLAGVLYVLDEPSIGLHQRDNHRLIDTLIKLRDQGNTVIVVEHDEDTIRAADHVVDIGPGAGEHGGEVVFAGAVKDLLRSKTSLTGAYLSGRRRIEVPSVRRVPERGYISVLGARENNLKELDVSFPVGVFTCVTGVAGSGKSSLVNEILFKAARAQVNRSRDIPGRHRKITGLELIDKVIDIDQSPIGRTPRSNPATYTGMFDHIRRLFAEMPESRARGYKPGRFSFNVKGGRCEACSGEGTIRIEMNFLPDVFVTCEACHGARFNRETLEITYRDHSIADVLAMPIEQAREFFARQPPIVRHLVTLDEVGLGYVRLGQPATTLSGGEAQRVKLASELARRSTGKTLYILDEPTTGLHFEDVRKLLSVLHSLVDQGNTVVVIEHNLDVIKTADYLIDLGPDGGDRGGQLLMTGTPEEVASSSVSYTGQFLAPLLERA